MIQESIKKQVEESILTKHLLIESGLSDIEKAAGLLIDAVNTSKKILWCGNGGSAAIASHFSVDLTKNARVRCVNYNESDLLTCFSNDFGYDKWVEKCIEYYGKYRLCISCCCLETSTFMRIFSN